MKKSRTIGTLLIAALIGLVTVLLVTPKKVKKTQEVKKDKTDMFI